MVKNSSAQARSSVPYAGPVNRRQYCRKRSYGAGVCLLLCQLLLLPRSRFLDLRLAGRSHNIASRPHSFRSLWRTVGSHGACRRLCSGGWLMGSPRLPAVSLRARLRSAWPRVRVALPPAPPGGEIRFPPGSVVDPLAPGTLPPICATVHPLLLYSHRPTSASRFHVDLRSHRRDLRPADPRRRPLRLRPNYGAVDFTRRRFTTHALVSALILPRSTGPADSSAVTTPFDPLLLVHQRRVGFARFHSQRPRRPTSRRSLRVARWQLRQPHHCVDSEFIGPLDGGLVHARLPYRCADLAGRCNSQTAGDNAVLLPAAFFRYAVPRRDSLRDRGAAKVLARPSRRQCGTGPAAQAALTPSALATQAGTLPGLVEPLEPGDFNQRRRSSMPRIAVSWPARTPATSTRWPIVLRLAQGFGQQFGHARAITASPSPSRNSSARNSHRRDAPT